MRVTIHVTQRDFGGITRTIYRNKNMEVHLNRRYLALYDVLAMLGYNDTRNRPSSYIGTDGSLFLIIPKRGSFAVKGGMRLRCDPLYTYEGGGYISFRSINRLFNVCIRYNAAKKRVYIRQPGRHFTTMHGDTVSSLARLFHTTVKRLLAFNKNLSNPIPPNTRIKIPTYCSKPRARMRLRSLPTAQIKVTPSKATAIIAYGRAFLGTPYQFGALPYPVSGKFDCSSYTQYIFGQNGIALPRSSAQQSLQGSFVPQTSLRRGDLIFFTSPRYTDNRVGHVGLHIGNGQMLNTFAPQGVNIRNWQTSPNWLGRYLLAKRIPG